MRSARELREMSRNKKVVDAEVREILMAMQAEMIKMTKEGCNCIIFAVPKTYASIGDDPDTAMVVVTTVLKKLISLGYDVKITDIKHSYDFKIRWIVDITERDRRDMNELIERYTNKDDE